VAQQRAGCCGWQQATEPHAVAAARMSWPWLSTKTTPRRSCSLQAHRRGALSSGEWSAKEKGGGGGGGGGDETFPRCLAIF